MRKIKMVVGNKKIGTALTWAYPNGQSLGIYKIPTYTLTVSGELDDGKRTKKDYEILRFGIQGKTSKSARVVGLADAQKHKIKSWLPNYTVHSARSLEQGAWQVYGNFLIHDGPDDPKREVYASIGCLEVCNGPRGFDKFNDFIIELSGSTQPTRKSKLKEIGKSRVITIHYKSAVRPPLGAPIP